MKSRLHCEVKHARPIRVRVRGLAGLTVRLSRHVPLLLVTFALFTQVDFACGAPIQIYGYLTGYVANGGIPTVGIESGYTFQGSLRGSGANAAPDSFSMGRFTLTDMPNEITLKVIAEQFAAVPTSPSSDFKTVYLSVGLRIEAFVTTRYELTGVYSFLSELPGSEIEMSLFVKEVSTDLFLDEVQLTIPGAGQERMIAIGGDETSPSDVRVADFSGVFQAGEHYLMELHLSFANPYEAVATGKTIQPFVFHFLQVPEPSCLLSISLGFPALLVIGYRRRIHAPIPCS